MAIRSSARKVQRKGRVRFEILIFLALLVFVSGLEGQQRRPAATASVKGDAQGSLRVVLTVQSSVGIVMDEDGQAHVIVANAPDVRDGVVYWKEASPGETISAQSATSQNLPSVNRIIQRKLKPNQVRGIDRND